MPTLKHSRSLAFNRQGGRCYCCGLPLWLKNPAPLTSKYCLGTKQTKYLQCTAEHLQARCEGGTNESHNIAAACGKCNRTRHKMKVPPTPEKMRQLVKKRVAKGTWHYPWVYEKGLLLKAGR